MKRESMLAMERRTRAATMLPQGVGLLVLASMLLANSPPGFGETALDPGEVTSPLPEAAQVPVAEPEIERLVARLGSDDPERRQEARRALLARGASIWPHLLEQIEHTDFVVRWEVVNLLGHLKDARALPPLVERAVTDSSPHVRWRALWALAVLHQDESVTAELERRMADQSQRWNAAVGLSMFARPEAISVLLEGTRNEDPWIRFEAIYGLARSFDQHTSTALLPLLDHPDARARQETVMSLGKIGDEAAVRGLVQALRDPKPKVRWRAALGLKLAGDPRALPALYEMLVGERDETERAREAVQSLQSVARTPRPVATAEVVPVDRESVSEQPLAESGTLPEHAKEQSLGREVSLQVSRLSGSPAERRQAREAILAFGVGSLRYLVDGLEHPDFLRRWEIVNILGNLGDPRAESPLIDRVLFDDNHHVRWRALWALAALGLENAEAGLLEHLGHPDRSLRWRAAVGASMFARQEAVPMLIEGLQGPDTLTRWEAVNALARVHDDRTTEVLLPLLDDPDAGIRNEVVLTLSRISDAPALRTLVELLDHTDPQIRWRAAMGLGFADYAEALDALRDRLRRETVPLVREHVRQAIVKLIDR